MMTSSIIPYIWFDGLADAAARFYTAVFPESRYLSKFVIKDTPSGDCDQVTFTLAGQTYMAIDGGPFFTLNPSISFFVNCRSEHQLRTLWHHLIALGEALMPLDAYPFSPLYGWVKDRFGITWQLRVDPESERRGSRP